LFIRLGAGSAALGSNGPEGLWKWRRRGKRGKAQAAFPLFTPPLGNLANSARFPHSHSLASPRMEKWKTKIRFPTFPLGARNDGSCFGIFRTYIQERKSARSAASFHRFSGALLYWKRNPASGSSLDYAGGRGDKPERRRRPRLVDTFFHPSCNPCQTAKTQKTS
jgi:hypothetical protein